MQLYLQESHILEETVVFRCYGLLGLAVIHLSICISLFIDEFHQVCKWLKVMEKENMTVSF